MQTIKTSKGKTYEVMYAIAPLRDGSCGIALRDQRRLPEIAGEFDQLEWIEYQDFTTMLSPVRYLGYSKLWRIVSNDGVVTMHLVKEE